MNQEQIKVTQFKILEEKLPLYPEIWTQEHIEIWLETIGMSCYLSTFKEMKIDGYLILDLEENDLENELQISKKLHRKKILKAISLLQEYNSYLSKKISHSIMKIESEKDSMEDLVEE